MRFDIVGSKEPITAADQAGLDYLGKRIDIEQERLNLAKVDKAINPNYDPQVLTMIQTNLYVFKEVLNK